jgi:hypothetical protein
MNLFSSNGLPGSLMLLLTGKESYTFLTLNGLCRWVLEDEAGKFSLVAQLSTVPTKPVQALLSLP